jgi:hypothetical protein
MANFIKMAYEIRHFHNSTKHLGIDVKPSKFGNAVILMKFTIIPVATITVMKDFAFESRMMWKI